MLTWAGLKIPRTNERHEDGARVETACVIAVPWGPVLSRHHLTPERYREMRDEQGGVCPMCGDGFWWRLGKMMPLVIDHDHACCPKWSCGRCVRGLLCHICNSALPAVERHLRGDCYGPCPPARFVRGGVRYLGVTPTRVCFGASRPRITARQPGQHEGVITLG